MRVIFMGSPEFSIPALNALVSEGHEIVALYCQPPRKAKRGKKEEPTPVQKRAQELGLNVRCPLNFNDPSEYTRFKDLNADIAVVVAYGLILPDAILNAPPLGCINIHASLLPRWRGAAPIHRAIMAGDTKTGISIMRMNKGLDTGDILLYEEIPIYSTDTTALLHDRLSQLGADLICHYLKYHANFQPKPQSTTGITYASKITKDETQINWSYPAHIVDWHIRALSPFPGAWFLYKKERIKVHLSEIIAPQMINTQEQAGTILDDRLTIACSSGAVRLLQLQRAGKTVMDRNNFLHGFNLPIGYRLKSDYTK